MSETQVEPETDATNGSAGAWTASRPIRVVVADDSFLIRESLQHAFSGEDRVEIVGLCADRHDLEETVAEREPDVVLTDIRMPPSGEEEGIQAAARLRETHPHIGVVVLSQYADPEYAMALLQSGTSGRAYLLKERLSHRGELLDAIEAVATGGSVIDPRIVEVLIEARSAAEHSPLADLTARERELLALIAEGKSNAAIAETLVLTKRAVEKHVNSIFAKLDLADAQFVSRRVMAALIFLSEQGR
jgi:DNA-binding NarL/FixJ family response regulator